VVIRSCERATPTGAQAATTHAQIAVASQRLWGIRGITFLPARQIAVPKQASAGRLQLQPARESRLN